MRGPEQKPWLIVGVVGALGVALLLTLDVPLRHGYTASWYHDGPEHERVLVDTTTEHRVEFPNVYRPIARYVNGWPHDVMPRLTGLPQIDAALRARIEIPEGPALHLGADVNARARIWADGEPCPAERALAPGPHDLWIHWEAAPRPHPPRARAADTGHFRLRWGPGENPGITVPASALTPADGAWPAGRVALWLIGLPLLWLFVFLSWRAAFAPVRLVRQRRWGTVLALSLVLIATAYRAFDYDVMPELRENGDELFATWNGWSLLEDGTPRGWSLWAGSYGGEVNVETVQAWSQQWHVITPYFEHPPLMHVLVGAAAHLGGAEHWLDSKLQHTRIVPIALMALSTWLLILVARRYSPEGYAPYLGALVWAVMPIVSMQGRVIKEESMLVPLGLAMTLFFLRWREHKKTRDLVGAGMCAGLATLAKIPAIVWVPAVTMLVAAEQRRRRDMWMVLGIGLGAASLVLVYAAAIDIHVFFLTQGKQGGRPTHWNLFARFLDHAQINHNHIGRGWILFLWVGFLFSVAKRGWRNAAVLTVPMVTYLSAIAIGSGNWTFGWYSMPLYPFLCIGAGDFLADLWKKPTLLRGTLFVTLCVFYTLNFTLDQTAKLAVEWPWIRRMVTLVTAGFLAPYALVQVWPKRRDLLQLARASTLFAWVTFVVFSGWFTVHYETIYETHHDYDLDEYWTS